MSISKKFIDESAGNLTKLGYSQYNIDENGTITNVRTGKILKPYIDKRGYENFSLWGDNGERKTMRGHQLVAKMYLENPYNYPQVDHIDGNKRNNNVNNLEWVSNEINVRRAIDNNLFRTHADYYRNGSGYGIPEISMICQLFEDGYSIKDINEEYGYSKDLLYNIKHRISWKQISDYYNF